MDQLKQQIYAAENRRVEPDRLRTRVQLVPPVVVLLGVVLSILAGIVELRRLEQLDAMRLTQLAEHLRREVQEQVVRYGAASQGLRAAFSLRGPLSHSDVRRFVRAQEIWRTLPGALAMGYVERVPRDHLEPFLTSVRDDGLPHFTVHSNSTASELFIVRDLEPEAAFEHVLGFDIAQEPARREAAIRAMLSGEPALTAKITLFKIDQAGPSFLVLTPIYSAGSTPATEHERSETCIGWVVLPVTAHEFFRGLSEGANGEVDVEIFDGADPSDASALYDLHPDFRAEGIAPISIRRLSLSAGGRNWTMRVSRQPGFRSVSTAPAGLLTVAGMLLSLLFGFLVRRKERAVLQAESHAGITADALAREERRLKNVIEGSDAGIWEWSVETNQLLVSERWAAMAGYSLEELRPVTLETWTRLMHPYDVVSAAETLSRIFSGELSQFECEGRILHRDGHWVWAVDHGKVIERNPDGTPRLLAGIRMDISERKEGERQLTEAVTQANRANRVKSEFLATMSHEIRTPLNGIVGMTDLLIESGLGPDQMEVADTVRLSAVALLSIVNDILDLSKIESGKMILDPIPVDLHRFLRELQAILAQSFKEKGVTLIFEKKPDVPRGVVVDSLRLRQVLVNLLGNARKFTPRGGTVILSVGAGAPDSLSFSVSDTGIGVSAEKQQRIFEAFTQADTSTSRDYGGTGLGLTISRRIVEIMGGELLLHSEEGRGATFSFTVPAPVHIEAQQPAAKETRGVSAGHGPLRILLAEDNPVNQQVARRMLEKCGHSVTVVENGEQAVELSGEVPFDLILMDLQMPVMDGRQATRLIRERELSEDRHVSIIAVTANAMSGDREQCFEAGMDGYVTKPISRDELLNAIATLSPHTVDGTGETERPANMEIC